MRNPSVFCLIVLSLMVSASETIASLPPSQDTAPADSNVGQPAIKRPSAARDPDQSSDNRLVSSWKDADAQVAFEGARRLQDRGLYEQALERFQSCLEKEPQAETHYYMGECLDVLERPELAADHLSRYLEKVPSDAEAVTRLGCVQLKCNRPDDAIKTFSSLVRLHGDLGRSGLRSAYIQKGEADLATKNYRQAEQDFAAALEVGGTDSESQDGMGRSLRGQLEEQEARGAFQDAFQTALRLYEYGRLDGLRSVLDRTFRAAGQPSAYNERLQSILKDPQLK